MSHFYGNMKGSRGETTRCGTQGSGIWAHIRGWSVGVYTRVMYDSTLKKDVVHVFRTTDSNGSGVHQCIATIVEGEDVKIHLPNGKTVRICDE